MDFKDEEIIDFIKSDVPSYQRHLLLKTIEGEAKNMDYYDNIGKELTGEGATDKMLLTTGPAINKTSFLDKVKGEVFLFICTENKKYKNERNLIDKNFKELATIMATAIASTFSVGTGVIIGIVTNILISIVKINKNAWCELQNKKNAP